VQQDSLLPHGREFSIPTLALLLNRDGREQL